MPPAEGESFREADYWLWIPPGVDRVEGVLLHQHGCGDGAQNAGRTAVHDLHWRELARKHRLAYLGSSLWPKDSCRDWCDPAGGTDRAFHEALAQLGEASRHPELSAVPWVIWGHSGGGFWAHRMLRRHPDRFVAAVLQSAGFGKPDEWGTERLSDDVPTGVPILVHVGIQEKGHERFGALFDDGVRLFDELRGKGAPVTLAVDPASGHDCGQARRLTIRWLDAVLGRAGGAATEAGAAAEGLDWLGAPSVVRPTAGRPAATWLPDESVAAAWKSFVDEGTIADGTPPAEAPVVEVAGVEAGRVELRWRARADLESGIRTFRLYRDGEAIGPYTAPGRGGEGTTEVFRKPNYSDTPDEPVSPTSFVDTGAEPGQTHRYQVATVNGDGLEGPRSAAVEAVVPGK